MFSALLLLAARHSTLLLVDLLHHLTAPAPAPPTAAVAGAAGAAGAVATGAAGAAGAGAAGAASSLNLELGGYVALLSALLDSASFRAPPTPTPTPTPTLLPYATCHTRLEPQASRPQPSVCHTWLEPQASRTSG